MPCGTAGKFFCVCAREDARESLTNINKDGGKFLRMLFAFSLVEMRFACLIPIEQKHKPIKYT